MLFKGQLYNFIGFNLSLWQMVWGMRSPELWILG
jgi:hypothetical protein